MTILITGATGFIGRHLVDSLRQSPRSLAVLARRSEAAAGLWPGAAIDVRRGDLEQPQTLRGLCAGVETVLHLAGCAHNENIYDPSVEARFRHAIVGGTEALLAEAVSAGVQRFVFVSSVKAMGEGGDACLDESVPERPASPYGRAKLAAERAVLEAGGRHGVHVSVVRFPLVYGPGNKGNIPRMIRAVDRGIFPPLAVNGNRRSMVHVADTVQAVLLAAEREAANGQTYIVTDGEVYSTRRIYDMIRAALGMAPRRWSMPLGVLHVAGAMGDLIGRMRGAPFAVDNHVLAKLIGSAWYSSDKIARELGYRRSRTLADALPEMVADYQREKVQGEEELAG